MSFKIPQNCFFTETAKTNVNQLFMLAIIAAYFRPTFAAATFCPLQ
jgi:hypothetical protein